MTVSVVQGGAITQGTGEDQARKREMRLLKNREAARECRRKKKEYIKCLENRVAVLENQNKALIDELKALKELYCQQKVEWESWFIGCFYYCTNKFGSVSSRAFGSFYSKFVGSSVFYGSYWRKREEISTVQLLNDANLRDGASCVAGVCRIFLYIYVKRKVQVLINITIEPKTSTFFRKKEMRSKSSYFSWAFFVLTLTLGRRLVKKDIIIF